MSAADSRHNITIWQGGTFGLTVVVKDANNAVRDLTGHTARMQIRSSYSSSSVAESLTTSNGEITVNATAGSLTLTLTAARTANITVDLNSSSKPPKSMYVYDLELLDSSNAVTKLLWGDVTVYGEVTR